MQVSKKQVIEALSKVNDPELKKDLVSLGMIGDVNVDGGKVSFTVELTTPACPMKNNIRNDCEKAVKSLGGVESVEVNFGAKVPASPQQQSEEVLIPEVKNVILVGSGKGGVGKSTIALNLACALALDGAKVGLMDADVYGPSLPVMLGAEKARPMKHPDKDMIAPIRVFGLKVMSIGFLMEGNTAVIWRGPLLASLITQFFKDVDWGKLDYLIVDLPPGTGDVPLTISQKIKATGAVLVTTPQDVALSDVYKAKFMFDKVDVPILGIIENMSSFICPECGAKHKIFPGEGVEKASKELDIPTLGKIPVNPAISIDGDNGVPTVRAETESEYGKTMIDIARRLAGKISLKVLG